ncbi:MAG: tetratricopeptide repeat protein [Bacteroidota bacterium]
MTTKKDLSFALRYLGSVYRGERNFIEAEKNATRALELAERINAKQQVLEAHEELSMIYEAEGNLSKALMNSESMMS